MSDFVFLAIFFGLPIIILAFVPRMFRRFCLLVSLPLVLYFWFFPHRGADNPLTMIDGLALVVFVGALVVELIVLLRGALARRTVHG